MLSLPDAASIEAALHQPLDSALHLILSERLQQIDAQGLGYLTHIVVIQNGDNEASVIEACGWSPLVHPIDGIRYGHSGFVPYWAWLRDLGDWHELIHPIGNDGFAYVLLIEKGDTAFSAMCKEGLSCDF
ncbi:hypothetical protein [Croceicoccus sediminis]|uniref:hypothetical protein n=1 Tax=Croceicoccus sediminis TaxID=2571150 RepID=UPI0011839640|nr:hypothetical protein [Croceicoccus sediminis]